MTPTQQPEPFSVQELPDDDRRLIEEYVKIGKAVDNLAYTDEFNRLYQAIREKGDQRSEAEIFRRLLNLRKAGWLPRVA